MSKTFKADVSDVASGIKRLYIDEIDAILPCPNCGREVRHSTEYISYGEGTLYFYCSDGCEHEWEIPVDFKLEITLTLSE